MASVTVLLVGTVLLLLGAVGDRVAFVIAFAGTGTWMASMVAVLAALRAVDWSVRRLLTEQTAVPGTLYVWLGTSIGATVGVVLLTLGVPV